MTVIRSVRPAVLAAVAMSTGLFFADPILASDYSNVCRSADGNFELQDDTLVIDGRPAAARQTFRVVNEQMLVDRQGRCEATSGSFAGQSFGYAFTRSLKTVKIRESGQDITVTMLCEVASSGLPAGANCDRDVTTRNRVASISMPPARTDNGSGPVTGRNGGSLWSHNGSLMRLEAEGARRTFVYEEPRRSLAKVGIKRGTVLFEGRKEGDSYLGQAYVFSSRCGARGFDVAGPVSADGRSVRVSGTYTALDRSCNPKGPRDTTLTFDLEQP